MPDSVLGTAKWKNSLVGESFQKRALDSWETILYFLLFHGGTVSKSDRN